MSQKYKIGSSKKNQMILKIIILIYDMNQKSKPI